MTTEREIRAPIESPEPYETRLLDNGFIYQGTVFQEDRHFDTPDGELTIAGRKIRIRKETGNNKTSVELTYKSPQLPDGSTIVRSEQNINIPPESIDDYSMFFGSIGYPLLYTIYKERRKYTNSEGIEVVLDNRPIVGWRIEIEGPEEEIYAIGDLISPGTTRKFEDFRDYLREFVEESGKSIEQLVAEYYEETGNDLGNMESLLV